MRFTDSALTDSTLTQGTTPNMPVDMDIIDKKVAQFSRAKNITKIKLIERLINFHGEKAVINGRFSKQELNSLATIAKRMKFKSTEVLSNKFYKEHVKS